MTSKETSPKSGHLHQAVLGLRWIGLSRIVLQASTWLLTILSVRFLLPADYGLVALSGLVTVLTTLILEGGMTAALVHKRPDSREVLATVATFLLIASSVTAVGLCFIAPTMAHFFHQPRLTEVLRASSLQLPLTALCIVPNAMLLMGLRFRELAITQASIGITQGLVTVVMAWQGFGYWALVVSTLLGLVGRAALLHWYARPPMAMCTSYSLLRPYMATSRHLIPQKITWFAIQEFDTFLIGRTLGAAPLGVYSTAKTLSHTLLDRIAEIVNQVSMPTFSAKVADRGAWLSGFKQMLALAACVTFPVFWGLAAIGPTILPLLLGQRWANAAIPFSLFCLIMPLRVSYSISDAVLVGSGYTGLSFGNVLVWALVVGPLLYIASQISVVAMAGAWAVGFPLVYLASTWRIARKLQIGWLDILGPPAVPALVAAAMWLLINGFASACEGRLPLLVLAPLEVLLGGVVYIAGLWLFCRARLLMLIGIAARVLGLA